jgi:hypothetical protein
MSSGFTLSQHRNAVDARLTVSTTPTDARITGGGSRDGTPEMVASSVEALRRPFPLRR